ncbi:MAG: hypothetical protein AAFR35_12655 [Pseudomonadota bacterium]
MARKPKTSDPEAPKAETDPADIVDAEIVEDIPAEPNGNDPDASEDGDGSDEGLAQEQSSEAIDSDETDPGYVPSDSAEGDHPEKSEAPAASTDDATPDPGADAEPIETSTDVSGEAEPKAPAETAKPAAQAPASRGPGFVPLLIGGVAAALVGFVLARYVVPEGWPTPETDRTLELVDGQAALGSRLDDVDARLAAFEARLSDQSAMDALGDRVAAAEGRVAEADGIRDALSRTMAELQDRLEVVQTEVEALALRPAPAGLDREELNAELLAFREELNAAIAEANAEIDAARAEAAALTQQADLAAETAERESARSALLAAVRAGGPFPDALAEYEAVVGAAPAVLGDLAEAGIPSAALLEDTFPAAARAALDAAIRSDMGGSTGDRLTAFFRVQTGARSLTPRDGDDPDAVLSRAEAAVRDADLATALTEIETLPDAGRAALSEWVAQAEARIAALDALAVLDDTATD